MWFCRHIIPTVGVLLTFGVGCFHRKSFLSSAQKKLLKQAMSENPDVLREIFARPHETRLNTLEMICTVKPLLTPEEINQLPTCSKALGQKYPGIHEIYTALGKPSNKSIMKFLALPIHGQTDHVHRLNQLDAALAAHRWIQVDQNLKGQSLIKEFRALIS